MNSLSFPTQYDRRIAYSPTGNRMQPTYSLTVDDDGVLVLSQSGQIDLYDKIQASRASVELKTILERYETDGIAPIDARTGFFADVTRLPSTLAGFFDQIHTAEAAFNDLPVEVRGRFDHSLSQFVSMAGTTEWYNRLGINTSVASAPAEITASEVSVKQPIVGGETVVA